MIFLCEQTKNSEKVHDMQKSWNPKIGIKIRHRDKLTWLRGLYIDEMKRTARVNYGQLKKIYDPWVDEFARAGWTPRWQDIQNYSKEVDFDEIIADIDKKFGFVNFENIKELPAPEIDANWFEEDFQYQRDVRSQSKQQRRKWKNKISLN